MARRTTRRTRRPTRIGSHQHRRIAVLPTLVLLLLLLTTYAPVGSSSPEDDAERPRPVVKEHPSDANNQGEKQHDDEFGNTKQKPPQDNGATDPKPNPQRSRPVGEIPDKLPPTANNDIVDLDSRTFTPSLLDGNIWLIEFYAPWCSHCTAFMSSYQQVAKYFHAQQPTDQRRIRVAKINGESERALASRFGVKAYPSFFLVDGFSVYSYDQARSQKNLIRFVEEDYKEQSPIPFYASPMGPMGLLQGLCLFVAMKVADVFEWLQTTLGLTPLLAGTVLFGSAFMACFFTIVILAIVITPKAKID